MYTRKSKSSIFLIYYEQSEGPRKEAPLVKCLLRTNPSPGGRGGDKGIPGASGSLHSLTGELQANESFCLKKEGR